MMQMSLFRRLIATAILLLTLVVMPELAGASVSKAAARSGDRQTITKVQYRYGYNRRQTRRYIRRQRRGIRRQRRIIRRHRRYIRGQRRAIRMERRQLRRGY